MNFAQRYWPHLVAVAHLPLLFLAGGISNSGAIGRYVGSAAASFTDPLPLLCAIGLGAGIARAGLLLLAAGGAAVAWSIVIGSWNGQLGAAPPYGDLGRFSMLLTVAFAMRLALDLVADRKIRLHSAASPELR